MSHEIGDVALVRRSWRCASVRWKFLVGDMFVLCQEWGKGRVWKMEGVEEVKTGSFVFGRRKESRV